MDLKTIETVADCLQQAKKQEEQGQLPTALSLYIRATEIEPASVSAWEKKGSCHFSQQNYDSARVSYEKAIELGSKAPWVRLRLGQISQKRDDPEQAIAQFKAAIALNPKNFTFHIACAESYAKLHQWDQAMRCCEQAIALNPNLPRPYEQLGDIQHAQAQLVAAKSSYEKAIELGSRSPRIRLLLGRIAQQQNKHRAAIAQFKAAISLNPKNLSFYMAWGDSCCKLKWLEEASSAYSQATLINPEAAEPYRALGALYFSQKQFLASQNSHHIAIGKGSKASQSRFHLARIAQEKGDSDTAYYWYREAIALNPNNAQFYYYLGNLQSQQSNPTQARASYTKALDVNPKFKPALDAIDTLSFISPSLSSSFEDSFFSNSTAPASNSSQNAPSPSAPNNPPLTEETSNTALPNFFQRILKRFRQ